MGVALLLYIYIYLSCFGKNSLGCLICSGSDLVLTIVVCSIFFVQQFMQRAVHRDEKSKKKEDDTRPDGNFFAPSTASRKWYVFEIMDYSQSGKIPQHIASVGILLDL